MYPARSSIRMASTSCCFISHDPAFPEVPRAADGREVDRIRFAAFVLIERSNRSAERGSLQLHPRAHLGEDRSKDRGLEIRGDGDKAVRAQEQDRLVAERVRKRGASLRAAD